MKGWRFRYGRPNTPAPEGRRQESAQGRIAPLSPTVPCRCGDSPWFHPPVRLRRGARRRHFGAGGSYRVGGIPSNRTPHRGFGGRWGDFVFARMETVVDYLAVGFLGGLQSTG